MIDFKLINLNVFIEAFCFQIKVAMAQVGTIRPGSDDQAMHDLLTDMIVDALRNSTVHVNLGLYPNCPRLSRYSATQNQPGYPLPLHYDSMVGNLINN